MAKLIQFIHPGVVHEPNYNIVKNQQLPCHYEWNKGNGHKRKFVEGEGEYLTGSIGKWQINSTKTLRYWCEAEWNTNCKQIVHHPSSPQLPQFYHTFVSKRQEKPGNNGLGTDPYIFGDYFKYVICRQIKNSSLQNLSQDDIILFGSCKMNSSKQFDFYIDTVFVVEKRLTEIHLDKNPSKSIVNTYTGISKDYYRRTLSRLVLPTTSSNSCTTNTTSGCQASISMTSRCGNSNKTTNLQSKTVSLYFGKMYSQSKQLFSFVPIMINLPAYSLPVLNYLNVQSNNQYKNGISSNLTRGIKITEIDKPVDVWQDIVRSFTNNGYSLGVHFPE